MDLGKFDEIAVKATRAYAMKPYGLSSHDCEYLVDGEGSYLDVFQCDLLTEMIGTGSEGEVTADEYELMESAGFTEAFLETMWQAEGTFAVRNRVKWLSQQLAEKTHYERKMGILSELSDMGRSAIEAIPTIMGVMQSDGMRVDGCEAMMYGIEHFPFMHTMSLFDGVFRAYPAGGIVGDAQNGSDVRYGEEVLPDDVVATHMQLAVAFAISNILGERAEAEINRLHRMIPAGPPVCLR